MLYERTQRTQRPVRAYGKDGNAATRVITDKTKRFFPVTFNVTRICTARCPRTHHGTTALPLFGTNVPGSRGTRQLTTIDGRVFADRVQIIAVSTCTYKRWVGGDHRTAHQYHFTGRGIQCTGVDTFSNTVNKAFVFGVRSNVHGYVTLAQCLLDRRDRRDRRDCQRRVHLTTAALFRNVHHDVANGAQLFNTAFDDVAVFQPHRWLAKTTYPTGCSGQNDVAWHQRHKLRDPCNNVWDIKNEFRGVAILHGRTVHSCRQSQMIDIGDLVQRDQGRSQWAKGILAFAQQPLPTVLLKLPITAADIVCHCDTGHMIECVAHVDVFAPLANDDGQFHFVIHLLGFCAIEIDVVGGAREGRGKFVEDHGFGRDRKALFFAMFSVIHTDAQHFFRF